MRKNLPFILNESRAENKKIEIKVLDKVKSNIFFKVLKEKQPLLPLKGDSLTSSKESLYEKIKSFQEKTSFHNKKLELHEKKAIYRFSKEENLGFEITHENADLLLENLDLLLKESMFKDLETMKPVRKNIRKFVFCEDLGFYSKIKSIFNEIELPESLLYKEIAVYLLDFIENFLNAEKIYKIIAFHKEIQALRKENLMKTEEINNFLKKIKDLQAFEGKYQNLLNNFEDLKRESLETQQNIEKIKTLMDFSNEKPINNIEELRVSLAEANIKLLEQKNEIKLSLDNINVLNRKLAEEQKIKENFQAKLRQFQDKCDQLELKVKSLEEKSCFSEVFKKPQKKPDIRVSKSQKLDKIAYFSQSLHK